MPFDATKPFQLVDGPRGFDPTKPFELVSDDEGFERPYSASEEIAELTEAADKQRALALADRSFPTAPRTSRTFEESSAVAEKEQAEGAQAQQQRIQDVAKTYDDLLAGTQGSQKEILLQQRKGALQDLGVSVLEEKSPMEQVGSPIIPLPHIPPGSTAATKIASGIGNAAIDLASFFTSPLGVATLGIGSLPQAGQKAVAGAFAYDMGRQVPEIASELGAELGKPPEQRDLQKISHLTASAVMTTGFSAGSAKHALTGRRGATTIDPERPVASPEAIPTVQTVETAKVVLDGIKAGLPRGSGALARVEVEPVAVPKAEVPVAEPVVAVPKVEPAAPVAELEATPKAVAEAAPTINPAPISSSLIEAKAAGTWERPLGNMFEVEIGQYRLGPVETRDRTKFGVWEKGKEAEGPMVEFDGRNEAIRWMQTQNSADFKPAESTARAVQGEAKAEPVKAPELMTPGESSLKLGKIGDAVNILGVDSVLAKSETQGGVRYDLFNGAKLKENRASVRVVDVDSGEVVTIKQYPTYDSAESAFNESVRVSKPIEQSALAEPTKAPPPSAPSKAEPVSTPTEAVSKVKKEDGIVAATEPVPRADVDNGTRHTEYRVRRVSDAERNARWETYGNTPWAVERRTIRTKDGVIEHGEHEEWNAFARGEDKRSAIEDAAGDTGFLQSKSMDKVHQSVVDRVNKEKAWKADKAKRLKEAENEVRFSENEVLRIKETANKKYGTALKRAGIYDEAQRGKADAAKIEAIQSKLQATWKPEFEKAKAKLAENIAKQKAIESEKLTDSKPTTPTPEFSPDALQSEGGQNLGITPSGVSVPAGTIDTLLKKTRQAFSVSGKLPREAHELQTAMEGQRRSSEFDIRMTQRDFMRAISEVYGIGPTARLGGGTKRIPPADVQLMDEYLHGRTTPEQSARIPEKIRGQLDNMRNQIEGWSQRTIDTLTDQMNRLDPDSAKAKNLLARIETIQENMDVYVHRSYKFFDSKKDADTWYGNLPLGDRVKAEQYLSTAKEITPEQARSELLRWLNDLKDESSGGTGGKLGSKDLTMFMQRKKIPAELRAVLGEYRNPVVNYAKSVGKMADFVAKQKFLDEVRKKGMGEWLFEEGSDPPGFNTRIAGEGAESMSPLAGLRTSKDIAEAFSEIDQPLIRKGVLGNVVRGYLAINAWTKFANTAQSIMTHSRNLMSRIPMAIHAGHIDPRYAGTALKAVWQDFAGSDKTWRPFVNRMYKLGVIGDTSRASELREVFKDAQLQDVAPAELVSWSLMRALKKTVVKLPGDIYRLTDEFGNIFGFLNERATQKRIHPEWTDAQLDTEAASVVRSIYPTYSQAPKIVQAFRHQPVYGPFVNFPYQAWRTVVNGVARSVHEIHSDNAVERQVGWKRLGFQIAAASTPHIAQEVSKLILGITSQEEDDMRRYLPEYDKGSTLIFTGKDPKTGELTYINASRIDPYSNVTDGVNSVASGIRQGKPVLEIMKDVIGDISRPFRSEQMLGKAFIEARNGRTDMGRDIFNPTDSSWMKLTKQTGHILTSLEPGTIQRAQKRIIPALRDEQPDFGRKLEPVREIAREVTGIAVEKFNFKTALRKKIRPFMADTDSAQDHFRKVATQTQKTSSDQIVEAYRESEKRRRAIWDDMRNNYMAAMRRGVPKLEAYSIMKARGLSKRDADSIENGVYKPQPITPYVQDRASQIGRKLPMDALNAERTRLSPQLTPEDRKRLFGK